MPGPMHGLTTFPTPPGVGVFADQACSSPGAPCPCHPDPMCTADAHTQANAEQIRLLREALEDPVRRPDPQTPTAGGATCAPTREASRCTP